MTRMPVKRHEVRQPEDTAIRIIPLTRWLNAIVDAHAYEFLNQWTWGAVETRDGRFYPRAVVRIDGKQMWFKMHQVLMPVPRGMMVDHIDLNGLNNISRNIRLATSPQNQCNVIKRKTNTTGYKGVFFYAPTKRWAARIGHQGKTHAIGYFPTKEEAAMAYDAAAIRLHGEFANLNFLREQTLHE